MASSSTLQQLLLQAPPQRRTSWHRHSVNLPPTAATTMSEASAAAEAVGEERLEPRVERREGGYWVLKEKYRSGINPQEKVKLEKEPMSLAMEDGIRELSAKSMQEIDASKLLKGDVDVRLKWLGLFHRRKHQCQYSFSLS